jgi:hypothetical protein
MDQPDAKRAAFTAQTYGAPTLGHPIVVTPTRHLVVQCCVGALATLPGVYARGGTIVEALYDPASLASEIRIVNVAHLRELLHAAALYFDDRGAKGLVPMPLPRDCVEMVHARGRYEALPQLETLTRTPVVTPTGGLLTAPGYYPDHRLVLAPDAVYPTPATWPPTHAEAVVSAKRLLALVDDFPFVGGHDVAAWLAALLTPLARHLFPGDAPLMVAEADVGGRGKTLLFDVISEIVAGRPAPRSTLSTEDEEARKRITALALGGEPLTLYDNVSTGRRRDGTDVLAPAPLNAALTSQGWWTDRKLGESREVTTRLTTTFYATGNQIVFHPETARRACVISLGAGRPTGPYRLPDLRGHVRRQRPQLLMDCLTILGGYIAAGAPGPGRAPVPSFEGWDLVRGAVVWATSLPDPARCLSVATNRHARQQLRLQAARDRVRSWIETVFCDGLPRTGRSWHDDVQARVTPAQFEEVLDDIRTIVGVGVGQPVSARDAARLLDAEARTPFASGSLQAQPARANDGRRFVMVP